MHSAMEQAKYWMWTRRKFPVRSPPFNSLTPPPTAIYNESWEEKAFAEDSSGLLGGCVWPPRSYSCSFCGREFRSAQALGGHMNVHRRDRARLKQSCLVGEEDHINIINGLPINPNPNQVINYSAAQCLWGEELKLGGKRGLDEEEEEKKFKKRKKMISFLLEEEKMKGYEEDEELDLELRLGDRSSS